MKQLSWVVAAAAALAIATPVRAQALADTRPPPVNTTLSPPASTTPPEAYPGPSRYRTTQANPSPPSNRDRSDQNVGSGSPKRKMPMGGPAVAE
jgi:hypothetical protein